MSEANYKIKATPINNKTWNEANDIEIVLSLDCEDETKVFKGIVSLSGIIKKGVNYVRK